MKAKGYVILGFSWLHVPLMDIYETRYNMREKEHSNKIKKTMKQKIEYTTISSLVAKDSEYLKSLCQK